MNITDTAYTRVAESTIAGKRYWIALHAENKADDSDTMIIKGKTNLHVTHISGFKITNITPDPDDATGKITEMEQMLPRQLFGFMKFTGASGTIGGKTWSLPQQRCKTMLLNNAIHIQASDGDTSLDLAKAGSLSGELHDQSSLPAHDRTWWSQYTMQHLQNAHMSVMKYPLLSKDKAGKWNTRTVRKFFWKEADLHVWSIGRNQMSRDKSINSIYFFYGQEAAKYFRQLIFDDKINIVSNPTGFHVSSGNTDMFGLGVRKTKRFANGWYGEVLGQYAVFARHIHTVNDGAFAGQKAVVYGQDKGISLELGRNIAVGPYWCVQPELQYTSHWYDQGAYTDSLQRKIDRVCVHDQEIRTGLKVQYRWLYARVNRYFRYENQVAKPIDTAHEIGIERHVHDKYDLRLSVSSRKGKIWEKKRIGNMDNKRQMQYNLWVQIKA